MIDKLAHDEFCQKVKNNEIIWGVKIFWTDIFYVSKFLAILVYFLILLLFLIPSLIVLYYAHSNSYWFLIFVIPIFVSSLSGIPGFNLIDIFLWFLIFVISVIMSLILGISFYSIGLIPVICFITSSFIKGMTMDEVENRLIDSPEKYHFEK